MGQHGLGAVTRKARNWKPFPWQGTGKDGFPLMPHRFLMWHDPFEKTAALSQGRRFCCQ